MAGRAECSHPGAQRATAEPLVATLGDEAIDWWVEPLSRHRASWSRWCSRMRAITRSSTEFACAHGAVRARSIGRDWPSWSRISPSASSRRCISRPKRISIHARRCSVWRNGSRSSAASIRFNANVDASAQLASCSRRSARVVNCTGLGARNELTDLRGVKGEMIVAPAARDISLQAAHPDTACAAAALRRAPSRRSLHGRRHHAGERRAVPRVGSLGAGTAHRRVRTESDVRRSRSRRDRHRRAPRVSRQPAAPAMAARAFSM